MGQEGEHGCPCTLQASLNPPLGLREGLQVIQDALGHSAMSLPREPSGQDRV